MEIEQSKHVQEADHCCGHDHGHSTKEAEGNPSLFVQKWQLWLSLLLLAIVLGIKFVTSYNLPLYFELAILLTAYLLAGHKTIRLAGKKAFQGDMFNEFTLMTIATFGAFYIGEYAEGVAVMIFYEIGELFQDFAVRKSKRSIKALLEIRPEAVNVLKEGKIAELPPYKATIGDVIVLKAGERLALDGKLLSEKGTFNTAALTGESKPEGKRAGDTVFAGMIALDQAVQIEVSKLFKDSKLSRILDMVQEASSRKAPTQLLISRLAKIYTPIVFGLALLIILVPMLFSTPYHFDQWLYRGMVFLVIACPCALTISIPLGYFGGIGLASRNGILVKGANFLDAITKIDTVVTDKTGTLTEGVFNVQEMQSVIDPKLFVLLTASLERFSTHPVAAAIVGHSGLKTFYTPTGIREIAGHGLTGKVDGQTIAAGNEKLMQSLKIPYPSELKSLIGTTVLVAVNDEYAGYYLIADKIKADAAETILALNNYGIQTIMLSGDKQLLTENIGAQLQIKQSYGGLLPEDKLSKVQAFKNEGKTIAFLGDGINDAPVLALANVGIAMGGLGADAAIETADMVIQNDQPSKLLSAIKIGKITKSVVYQNITLAMGVKILILLLGANGNASLWEAVFADVGVALLAILNAYRIQAMKV